MKKMFISVVALAMCVAAMATQTAIVQVKLTGLTGGLSNSVYLVEDDSYTSAYESGADIEKIMDQANSNSVLMYGFVGSTPCGYVVTDNLDGLNLGIKTNQVDDHYTLTFKNVSGRELTLYDRIENSQTTITNNGTYNFTVDASLVGQKEINDRFVIGVPSYSVTMNEYGWASFSSIDNLAIPSGLIAYKGALAVDVLSLDDVDYIKANQGVILNGNANQTYELNLGTGSSDFADNDLKPASAWESHAGTIYCLKGDALYEYTGATMPANKAYLQVGGSSAPRRISLQVNAEQGVENVKADLKAEKFVENGQILIKRGENVFNLQGQIVK